MKSNLKRGLLVFEDWGMDVVVNLNSVVSIQFDEEGVHIQTVVPITEPHEDGDESDSWLYYPAGSVECQFVMDWLAME